VACPTSSFLFEFRVDWSGRHWTPAEYGEKAEKRGRFDCLAAKGNGLVKNLVKMQMKRLKVKTS
jgi:hypothetical protein